LLIGSSVQVMVTQQWRVSRARHWGAQWSRTSAPASLLASDAIGSVSGHRQCWPEAGLRQLNRWPVGKLCAACFDAEAEKAKVRYTFVAVTAQSWSEEPPPRNPFKRRK
jgi:hypothetical protein